MTSTLTATGDLKPSLSIKNKAVFFVKSENKIGHKTSFNTPSEIKEVESNLDATDTVHGAFNP